MLLLPGLGVVAGWISWLLSQQASFTADATLLAVQQNAFTADAIIRATQQASFSINAFIEIVVGGGTDAIRAAQSAGKSTVPVVIVYNHSFQRPLSRFGSEASVTDVANEFFNTIGR